MYMYKVDLQVFPSKKLFFSLSLPPPLCLPCFFSTRSIVFIGFAANDAATLENGWCDFYRRTGNMGHKTRLHFPQPEKKTRPPPPNSTFTFPCQSTRPPWEVCIIPRRLWESEDVLRHGGLNSRHGQDHLTHTHAGGF